jgi:hypothetical protein
VSTAHNSPIVFDGVVSAPWQHLGYLRPLVSQKAVLLNDYALLHGTAGWRI